MQCCFIFTLKRQKHRVPQHWRSPALLCDPCENQRGGTRGSRCGCAFPGGVGMQKGRFSPSGAAAARAAEHSHHSGSGDAVVQARGWFQGWHRWLRRSHCVRSLSRGCVSWSAEEGDSLPPLSPRTGHSLLQIHFCSDISCMTMTFFSFSSFTLGFSKLFFIFLSG